MKRRITPEQLQELTPEQQERLRGWWTPQKYDVFINKHDMIDAVYCDEGDTIRTLSCDSDGLLDREYKSDCLPLLDNGQMIELLEKLRPECNIAITRFLDDFRHVGWALEAYFRMDPVQATLKDKIKEIVKPELFDVLFAALKAVL